MIDYLIRAGGLYLIIYLPIGIALGWFFSWMQSSRMKENFKNMNEALLEVNADLVKENNRSKQTISDKNSLLEEIKKRLEVVKWELKNPQKFKVGDQVGDYLICFCYNDTYEPPINPKWIPLLAAGIAMLGKSSFVKQESIDKAHEQLKISTQRCWQYQVKNMKTFEETKMKEWELDGVVVPKIVKPPTGIKPKKFVQEERFVEVCAAISRYYNKGLVIPIEWVNEYNELAPQVDQEKVFKQDKKKK